MNWAPNENGLLLSREFSRPKRKNKKKESMLSMSYTFSIISLANRTAMSRNRRTKSSKPVAGWSYPLYEMIFHAAIKDRIAGERMRNEQDQPCFWSHWYPGRLWWTSSRGTWTYQQSLRAHHQAGQLGAAHQRWLRTLTWLHRHWFLMNYNRTTKNN